MVSQMFHFRVRADDSILATVRSASTHRSRRASPKEIGDTGPEDEEAVSDRSPRMQKSPCSLLSHLGAAWG